MVRFVIKRILMMIPVLLGVLFIVFTLSNFMPGDPVINKLGNDYTEEQYEQVAEELGLNKPFFARFVDYVVGVVTEGDLGTSYDTNQPVMNSIKNRIGVTVQLGLLSAIVAVILGIPVGVISAVKQNTPLDYAITTTAIILACLPGFWLAMEAMIIFSLKLKLLPASGLTSWKHYILPVMCNALMSVASLTRMTRSSMLEVIRKDYIRTAQAKGMKERRVILRHALKNALIPIITVVGNQIGMIVGGAVIIETIFSVPGMGSLMLTGINNRDYPMIMGITLIICAFVCIVNLIVDLVYSFVDPQIRSQFANKKRAVRRAKNAPAKGVGSP